jgi:hypothetical protein
MYLSVFFLILQKSFPSRYPVCFGCDILPGIYSTGMGISSPLHLIAPGTFSEYTQHAVKLN